MRGLELPNPTYPALSLLKHPYRNLFQGCQDDVCVCARVHMRAAGSAHLHFHPAGPIVF